jgi:tripartite-type tricarboxylate transporter receptor subunit TctC
MTPAFSLRQTTRLAPLKTIAGLLASGAALLSTAGAALAQTDWPRQPIRIIVGLAPGAINDVQTRVIAGKLGERLGQPVIVENRPGAGGAIAAEMVARAAPDGYTLYNSPTSTITVNPAITTRPTYFPPRDFVAITQISQYPLYVTVNAQLPVRTLQELLAHAKANPDKANLATPGAFFDLMTAFLKIKGGADFVSVPFKSTPETMTAVLNGQAMIAYVEYNTLAPQLKSGRARAIVSTGGTRSAELPDVPSIAEAGFPEAVAEAIVGIVAPRATPKPIVKRLEGEINAIMKLPDVRERWRQMGLNVVEDSSSEAFDALIARDIKRWSEIAKAANIKIE